MSPELETLDQLLGGPLPLAAIRRLFDDESRFIRALEAMLDMKEVRLLGRDSAEAPRWQWRSLLSHAARLAEGRDFRLSITDLGARRVC